MGKKINKNSTTKSSKKKTRSKYKVKTDSKSKQARTITDQLTGKTITFDSDSEKKYYDTYIRKLYESGEILSYDLQVKYILQESFKRYGKLIRAIDYVADFTYTDKDNIFHVRDVKGSGFFVDSVAKIKRKLFYNRYRDIDFEWVAWDRYKGEWVIWDDFIKDESKRNKEKKAKKLAEETAQTDWSKENDI